MSLQYFFRKLDEAVAKISSMQFFFVSEVQLNLAKSSAIAETARITIRLMIAVTVNIYCG